MKKTIVYLVFLIAIGLLLAGCGTKIKTVKAHPKLGTHSEKIPYYVKCPECGLEVVFEKGKGLKKYKCTNCDTVYNVDYSSAMGYNLSCIYKSRS